MGGKCAPLPIQRSASIYTESRKSPKVKYFITDRKIIIELGYELLGYTFMGSLNRVKFGRRAPCGQGIGGSTAVLTMRSCSFSEREHLAGAAFCNDIVAF